MIIIVLFVFDGLIFAEIFDLALNSEVQNYRIIEELDILSIDS